ncbi:MAG: hypothetical protein HKP55_14510 [Gammaproteobacteria bacterium]|nr:hypothetical protein [Gammaproteobacteria bacterium]
MKVNEAVLGSDEFIYKDFVILNALNVDEVNADQNDLVFYGAFDAAA